MTGLIKTLAGTLALALLVSGCASTERKAVDISLRCDQPNRPFHAFVFCTELTLSGLMHEPKTRAYVLEGKLLLERVNKGELTEAAARREWQRVYPF